MPDNHRNETPSSYTRASGVLSRMPKSPQLWRHLCQVAIAGLVGLSFVLAFPQDTHASSGPHFNVPNPRYQHPNRTKQDPAWLQAKFAYRVWSGIVPGQGKGANTHPTILANSLMQMSAPTSSVLSLNANVVNTAEPGDGNHTNYTGTWNFADDAYHNYSDGLFFTWCGVGASDVTLWFWSYPPNFTNSSQVSSSMSYPQYSSWNAADIDGVIRLRGYMIQLADQTLAPSWTEPGMLSQSYYQSNEFGGVTLQVVRDALNWEASGHSSGGWTGWFYVVDWNSSHPTNLAQTLHSDIVSDISSSGVPVLVELPANYLPNWQNSSNVHHMVAIVGYDDNAHTYTYIDTCKTFTGCRYGSDDTWNPALTVDQTVLAQGVASIATNTTTGDGGWVW